MDKGAPSGPGSREPSPQAVSSASGFDPSRGSALRDGDLWDFRFNKNPKCPHCGHDCSIADNEWWFLYDEGEHDAECPLCEREFEVSVHVEYSFSTDYQADLEDHDSDGGPEGRDAQRLDGEAARARAEGIAPDKSA